LLAAVVACVVASREKVIHWQRRNYSRVVDVTQTHTLLLFVGHPRSGTTLVNAIIDAVRIVFSIFIFCLLSKRIILRNTNIKQHSQAVCANEFDVVKHFNIFEQGDLANEILFRSQFDVEMRNRSHTGFDYSIAGRFIRDKKIVILSCVFLTHAAASPQRTRLV
jgi:hypothetical protein